MKMRVTIYMRSGARLVCHVDTISIAKGPDGRLTEVTMDGVRDAPFYYCLPEVEAIITEEVTLLGWRQRQ